MPSVFKRAAGFSGNKYASARHAFGSCKPKSLFTMLSNYNLFYDRLNNAVKKAKGDKESRWLAMYSMATSQLAKEKFGF